MSKKYNGLVEFKGNFNVQTTAPLDDRSVVESNTYPWNACSDGTINSPYQGMTVVVAGSSDIWILLTEGIENAKVETNWKKVSGSDGGIISEYSIPIMTPAQRIAALSDPNSGFTEDTDFISTEIDESEYDLTEEEDRQKFVESIDYNYSSLTGSTANKTISSVNGTYLDIMMSAIKQMQAEITELKQIIAGGIHSYINRNTAKSATLYNYSKVAEDEPLWSIDAEDGGLIEIISSSIFNYDLDSMQNVFETPGTADSIDMSVDGQFTITGKAILYDRENTLFKLTDAKILTYIVSDGNDIEFELVNASDPTKKDTKTISIKDVMNGATCNKYAINVIVSRKVKSNSTTCGYNYVYISVMNFETNEKLIEGYLKPNGTIGFKSGDSTRYELEPDTAYSINSIKFTDMTLYRLRFYTKYQDFSESVVASNPIENLNTYKYNTAHITIRSVEDNDMLEEIKDQLQPNELIWVENVKKLKIKASNGNVYAIGSGGTDTGDSDNDNNDDNMTNKQILDALVNMGIVTVNYVKDTDGYDTDEVVDISVNSISDFTFINEETEKEYTFSVDAYGNLIGKDMSEKSITDMLDSKNVTTERYDTTTENVRGFSADYFSRMNSSEPNSISIPNSGTYTTNSDRVRISSFYAPLATDKVHGCSHSFIELENSSKYDFPLDGAYLHFYNPVAVYDATEDKYSGKVYHLALDGVLKAGSTYLVRGAQHVERMDDANCFIKVESYDKEWRDENGELVSFEQMVVIPTADGKAIDSTSKITEQYRFCLTYGLPELSAETLVIKKMPATSGTYSATDGSTYDMAKFPVIITNPRFIDGISYSSFSVVAKYTNNWYACGLGLAGITITENSMFRLMFELDPAKQAFNGWTTEDGSRVRYNKAIDLQVVSLAKEYIGYPFSEETVLISRYTPRASYENRNVMTDKTQLNFDKPNMVTCSFGIDVYKTRCFNWVSCGLFDEGVWIRKSGTSDTWSRFASYGSESGIKNSGTIMSRKAFNSVLTAAAYNRITNRFPGNDVQFTSHKCIVTFADYVTEPTKYEYVVGRADKNGNPDSSHISDVYTFTLYPSDYEGRVYQITDQQGFHWIEYQVWAAAAEYLNSKIDNEMSDTEKTFPILLNTGDMTQSGARINEWLDYYNAGKSLFNHLEQMNCVGNNDLCCLDPRDLGTGDDPDKSNSLFFHYFYCFEVDNDEKLVVHAHTGLDEDRFIPSIYYFNTKDVMYIMMNSELTSTTCSSWYMLTSSRNNTVNIYTGIEMISNGLYDKTTSNFTPIYETLYGWLNGNTTRKVVMAMHEMPFTVITKESMSKAAKSFAKNMPSTRNHPTAGKRVGSNANQLVIGENRGIYWCSRLLEHFGCKLVIGGHKHTYALSYPIKEKYTWRMLQNDGTYPSTYTDSKTSTKPMSTTLEDEAGATPTYELNWIIAAGSEELTNYIDVSTYNLNSTKTPYIPEEMYNKYGLANYTAGKGDVFRCCTPISTSSNSTLNGFVNYSMCQATGYKLKSNKELPSPLQLFSKVIPQTSSTTSGTTITDSPNANQLYPMYSVLIINHDDDGNVSDIDVRMRRITGIFKKNGADKFDQTNYGSSKIGEEELLSEISTTFATITDINATPTEDIGTFGSDGTYVYECISTNGVKSWKILQSSESASVTTSYTKSTVDMYGCWTSKLSGTYLNVKY